MPKLSQKDVLRADQFTSADIDLILTRAAQWEAELAAGRELRRLRGKILATLFFEPSTRTRLSFESAMHRLGGQVLSVSEAKSTSAAKGESLQDTIRTVDGYVDAIVIRHPEIGSAEVAAHATAKPVINAGDGAGEHPTQSLLDLYTIRKEQGKVEGLTIALVGDLKHGRTVHSLATLLSRFRVSFLFVAPPTLAMPSEIVDRVKKAGGEFRMTDDLRGALDEADVVYMTRIQRERFAEPAEYDRLKNSYVLTRAALAKAKPSLTIMHPLPRVNEIATDVDALPGAAYFRQTANGVPVRMAILDLLLSE